MKDESSTKNIQIPKYEELNSYLHKLNKLFNDYIFKMKHVQK